MRVSENGAKTLNGNLTRETYEQHVDSGVPYSDKRSSSGTWQKKRISDAFHFIVFWKVLLDLRSVEEGLCAESPIG